jgi:hypothetical protein
VFESSTAGGTWKRVGPVPPAAGALPNTPSVDLHVTPTDAAHPDPQLVVATHGRGLWSIPVADL